MKSALAAQLASRLERRYAKSRPPKARAKYNAINKPPGLTKRPTKAEIEERTPFTPDAPAPRLEAVIEAQGPELAAEAITAWDKMVHGNGIIDVAHEMKVSIETARVLINQVKAAIAEDLAESVTTNRELDLARIDRLIRAWFPLACAGDEGAANVMVKLLGQRGKLTGASSEQPDTKLVQPQNILVWIQSQLPSINRIVDSLPIE